MRTLLLGHLDDRAVARLGEALDSMDHPNRLFTVMSASKSDMKKIWDLTKDQSVGLDHFVPSGTEPMKEVIHHGKNTLPVFTHFQKRFCLPEAGTEELYGYNENPDAMVWLIGPGYFVAHSTQDEKDAPSDFAVDYYRIPPKKPETWPDIRDNDGGFRKVVYGRMKDYMRRVSSHVSIGHAFREGESLGQYFMLCREDPS
jgi:hypothetical protein